MNKQADRSVALVTLVTLVIIVVVVAFTAIVMLKLTGDRNETQYPEANATSQQAIRE